MKDIRSDEIKGNRIGDITDNIKIIRSGRRTLALQITAEAELVVRAPYRMPEEEIWDFVDRKEGWIRDHLRRMEEKKSRREELPGISAEEIEKLADRALLVIPERVAYYAPLVGVSYGRITIRNQKTRWGSCSARGNLNFNCLLMLTPTEVLDYVVVHELCHRLEMNHSPRFWSEVARVLPDYALRRKWLKEHGGVLISRMKNG